MSDVNETFWAGKKTLVGGGFGFLGSYMVAQLIEAKAIVTVADNLNNAYARDLSQDNVEFIQGDLSNSDLCDRLMEKKDIVINLAAKAYGMEYSRSHNGEMLVSNLLCTLVPLESARRQGVERFVIMSSSCVYPDEAPVPTPELPVFTGNPESVNEGYGWAKRIQELAGTYYAQDYGMKVAVVRPFNPYGGNYRWDSEERAHVIPSLVKRIMDGSNPLVVWGSGNQRRNFLHASDATRLIMKVIEKDFGPEPINIGYDEDTSIAELVDIICDVADTHPEIIFDTNKPEGRFRKCAEASLLQQVTDNWKPKVSLREGIAEMVEWYKRTF